MGARKALFHRSSKGSSNLLQKTSLFLCVILAIIYLSIKGPIIQPFNFSAIVKTSERYFSKSSNPLPPSFNLQRSGVSITFEHELEVSSYGLCQTSTNSQYSRHLHADVCKTLPCMWSDTYKQNIDLTFSAFRKLPKAAHPAPCPAPTNGQLPSSSPSSNNNSIKCSPPKVSLVLLAGNSGTHAIQSLLEMFRTSHEVESVEFIVICSNSDGCHPDMSTMATALRNTFSINVQLINAMTDDSRSSVLKTAIQASRGKFTAFVGAGTMVARGWLTLLLSTFDDWKQTGLAGCSIYTPSQNSIQLGGRVGQAGELSYKTLYWPQEEDTGELYLTWPDFVDTDCAMARTDIARSALATAPMYGGLHADADLAYAMRRSGYNVVMQPLAFSGAEDASKDSHINNNYNGDNNNNGGGIGRQALSSSISGTVQSQEHLSQHMFGSEQDKVTFLARYMGAVSQQCSKDGDAAKPSILWIEDSVPMPDRDSGSVRLRGLMKILLREGYNVAMLPLRTTEPIYALQARALGVKVLPLLRIGREYFDEELGTGSTTISKEDGSIISKPGVLTGCPYSAIIIGRRGNYNVTEQILSTTCPSTPVVFDTVDIHFLREMRTEALRRGHTGFSSWESLLKWADVHLPILAARGIKIAESLLLHRDRELELIAKANITWVVSSDEAEVIGSYLSGIRHKVGLITNVFETNSGSTGNNSAGGGCERRRGMLFVGNYDHIPNQQAVEFLLVYILPKLKEKRPDLMEDLHLHLVGSGQLPTKLESLLDQNNQLVTYHGYQSDEVLDVFYKGVKVALAPLLVGAGVKGKINQAMHLGVPVVATPVGVEGMHAEHGVDCLIASEPEEFSEAIINVATDCELWERLVEGGRRNIERHFSDVVARKMMVEMLSAMGAGPKPGCVLVTQ